MKYILLIFSICNFYTLSAQEWFWARQEKAGRLAADSAGNVYLLADSTLKHFNKNGQPLWSIPLNGTFNVTSIAADNNGNLYIASDFSELKIAGHSFHSQSGRNAAIIKLDPNGQIKWSLQKTHALNDYINDVFIDKHNRIFICGGHTSLTDTVQEFYIEQVGADGNVTLSRTFSGGRAWEIANDHAGHICLLGGITYLKYAVLGNFQIGPGDYHGSHFTAAFNADGSVQWAQSLGGNYYTPHVNLGMDTDGSIYLTKWGRYSGFTLRKWNKDGVLEWTKYKTSVYGDCNDLTIDYNDKIWLTGNLWQGEGNQQQFIWKFDKNGDEEEMISNFADGYQIEHDYYSNIYVSGYIYSSATFGNITLDPATGNNFLAKLGGNRVIADFTTENPLCEGQQIIFHNTSVNDTAAYWQFEGGIPATSMRINDTVSFTTPGEYIVKLTASNSHSSDTIIKTITIYSKPQPPVITQIGNALYSSYNSSNQWYYESTEINKATDSIYRITVEGNYAVKYTDTNGCFTTSTPHNASFYQISENVSPLTKTWSKKIHYSKYNQATDIVQTSDNGFIMCALTYGDNKLEAVVIKFSSDGEQEWAKVISPGVRPMQIMQIPDGNYTLLADGGGSVNLIRLNQSGEVISVNTYNYKSWGVYPKSFDRTSDGGFIIQAFFHSEEHPFYRTFLLKTAANGAIEWSRMFLVQGYAGVGSIKQTSDGGFVMNGYGSFPCCTPQHYICKLSAAGTITWIREFQNATFSSPANILDTGDGYMMAGTTTAGISNSGDIYTVKVDYNGNLLWSKSYGTVYNDEASRIQQVNDGFVIAGRSNSFNNQYNVYLLKIDANGNELWTRAYGSSKDDAASSIIQTSDGGLVIAGTYEGTSAWSEGGIYFFKTDAMGHAGCNEKIIWTTINNYEPPIHSLLPAINNGAKMDTLSFVINSALITETDFCSFNGTLAVSEISEDNAMTLYPNPSEGKIIVETPLPITTFRIYNLLGECVYQISLNTNRTELNLDLPNGIYLIEAKANGRFIQRKLIMQ